MSGSGSSRNHRREARTRAEGPKEFVFTRFSKARQESFCPLDTDLSWMSATLTLLDYGRVARYSGRATCQSELRFLLSAGRRSAHFRMASSVGQRDWPHGVRRYSTFGGT